MSVIKTLSCSSLGSPECGRQTSASDDVLLSPDILIYHSLRGGSHPWIHTHIHGQKKSRCHSFSCLHTHTHTPAGWGGAKSQESCGLINYHLKETKVGPPEVMAFLSNCSKAVSWKVKNTFKSLRVHPETRWPWSYYSSFTACTL